MPFEDPWLREGQTISPLDRARRMYAKTENPIHAWRALEICADLMREGVYGCDTLPPWLLDYLMTSVDRIRDIFNEDPDGEVSKRIAAALGFKPIGRGVRRQAFRDFARDDRDQMLAKKVWRGRRLQPTHALEAIVAAVAEAEQVSPETVWRAWSTWNADLDEA